MLPLHPSKLWNIVNEKKIFHKLSKTKNKQKVEIQKCEKSRLFFFCIRLLYEWQFMPVLYAQLRFDYKALSSTEFDTEKKLIEQ